MSSIKGFAHISDGEKISISYDERLKALNRNDITIITVRHGYALSLYNGTINNPDISDLDIALLCDSNLCFGGYVNRSGNKFECRVYTD